MCMCVYVTCRQNVSTVRSLCMAVYIVYYVCIKFSCRELKMQQRSKSKIRKHADNKCENTIPFPICLVMEKTWKKTRLAVPMDYVSRTWSFSCIGLEPSVHNEFQTVQNRTLRSGTKYVEGKISFTDQSEMTGSDALKKLPNPSVHLETVGRMQSKQFESLLLLLSQKQLLLVTTQFSLTRIYP